MSSLVKKHWNFLQLLISTAASQRKKLLDTITSGQLKAIVEIVVNVLQNVLRIPASYKRQLIAHRRVIRRIADRTIDLASKKRILSRHARTVVILLKAVYGALKKYVA